jgi:hypothetical protein
MDGCHVMRGPMTMPDKLPGYCKHRVRVMTSLSDGRIPQIGPIIEAELAS